MNSARAFAGEDVLAGAFIYCTTKTYYPRTQYSSKTARFTGMVCKCRINSFSLATESVADKGPRKRRTTAIGSKYHKRFDCVSHRHKKQSTIKQLSFTPHPLPLPVFDGYYTSHYGSINIGPSSGCLIHAPIHIIQMKKITPDRL